MVQVFGNKCLDVTDGVNADGVKMQIWSCWGQNPNQQWYYDKACFPPFPMAYIYLPFISGRTILSGQIKTSVWTLPTASSTMAIAYVYLLVE